jgi:hydrogenase nickel incorporation protein HypB
MNQIIPIQSKILSENDRLAGEIRSELRKKKIFSLNLVSSPGAGKTTLLEKTISALQDRIRIGLIAGDVQTENDANRLLKAGGTAVQPLVTAGACHLDAKMISGVLPRFDLSNLDLLIIENVGNLVCPSSYDLGEDKKVVLLSVPEGDDKPLKYPAMFRRSAVLVLNKTDLLGTSDFDIERAKMNARSINPDLHIFAVSCRTGDCLVDWFDWLQEMVKASKGL